MDELLVDDFAPPPIDESIDFDEDEECGFDHAMIREQARVQHAKGDALLEERTRERMAIGRGGD